MRVPRARSASTTCSGIPPNARHARRKASFAPRWESRKVLAYGGLDTSVRERSAGSMCVRWTYSSRTVVGIGPRRVDSGGLGETTMGVLTRSSLSWGGCGGARDQDPPTPTGHRLLWTGTTTAPHV